MLLPKNDWLNWISISWALPPSGTFLSKPCNRLASISSIITTAKLIPDNPSYLLQMVTAQSGGLWNQYQCSRISHFGWNFIACDAASSISTSAKSISGPETMRLQTQFHIHPYGKKACGCLKPLLGFPNYSKSRVSKNPKIFKIMRR